MLLELSMSAQQQVNSLRNRIFLQFKHDPDSLSAGFVAQVRQLGQALVLHQVGDLLDELGLIHLKRQLCNDESRLVAVLLDRVLSSRDNIAPVSYTHLTLPTNR